MSGGQENRSNRGLIWSLALVLPIPILFLADIYISTLHAHPLELDLMLARPLILLPGIILLGFLLRASRTERLAHVGGYLIVGLLLLPWYLKVTRLLHDASGF